MRMGLLQKEASYKISLPVNRTQRVSCGRFSFSAASLPYGRQDEKGACPAEPKLFPPERNIFILPAVSTAEGRKSPAGQNGTVRKFRLQSLAARKQAGYTLGSRKNKERISGAVRAVRFFDREEVSCRRHTFYARNYRRRPATGPSAVSGRHGTSCSYGTSGFL